MNILILEDDHMRNHWFKQNFPEADMTDTVSGFEALLNKKTFSVIMLDHDLGGGAYLESGPGTGYEASKILSKSILPGATILIHSWNGPGALNIKSVLPEAIIAPFGMDLFMQLTNALKEKIHDAQTRETI